jgi:hypothetical protein
MGVVGFGCLLLCRVAIVGAGKTFDDLRATGSIQTDEIGEDGAGRELKPQAKHVSDSALSGALHMGHRF